MRVKHEFAEAQRRFGLLGFYDKFEHSVHWYLPIWASGQLEFRNGPTAPSVALWARIAAAAACPTAMPCALAGVSGRAPRAAV
jgi:hypothetical protein